MAKARVGVFSGLGAKKSGVPSHAARTKPILSYEAKLFQVSVISDQLFGISFTVGPLVIGN